jgi:carbonic anhydrase
MNSPISTGHDGLIDKVLTQEERDKLTPDEIIAELKVGNGRFVAGDVTIRNHKAQIREATAGQSPKAIILSCVDSRVPVEDVFDLGIGDIFVARVAGNFVNTDILGSMEFACHVAGAKLILVMGHEQCGAIMSAVDRVDLGNITAMLSSLLPAVDEIVGEGFQGEHTSVNEKFVHAVCERNVRLSIARIRAESPLLLEREEAGQLVSRGGLYDLSTGAVTFLD